MKKSLVILVLAALPGIGAVAQNDFREAEFPKTEVFVGPAAIVSTSTNQFIGGSNAIFDDGIGIGSSLTYNFNSWFGITGEASVEAGSGNLILSGFPGGFQPPAVLCRSAFHPPG